MDQLYCTRGSIIRNTYMPVSLPVEDRFLSAMVVTDDFKHENEQSKITATHDVCYYFGALLSRMNLCQHEKRLAMGSFINMLVYRYLWKTVAETGKDPGFLIEELNKNALNWRTVSSNNYKLSESFWIVKRKKLFKRITQLITGDKSYSKKILLLLSSIISNAGFDSNRN